MLWTIVMRIHLSPHTPFLLHSHYFENNSQNTSYAWYTQHFWLNEEESNWKDASRYHRRSMWLMIILHWKSCFFSKPKITFLIILKINWLHCWEGWQWRNECKALIDPLHTTEMMMMMVLMVLMILLFGLKIMRKTLSERSCYSASYAVGPLIVSVQIMGSCTYCHGLWDASPIVAWEFKKD